MPTMPGPMELLIIAALALIVFGPARLPDIARSIGKAVNEFRRQASDLKAEFDLELDQEEERPGRARLNDPVTEEAAAEASKEPEPDEKPSQDPDPSTEPEVAAGPDPTAPEGEPRPDKS